MPTLSIQLPGLPAVSHVLKDETITIGRMKGNTIVVEDASISLMHAKITRKDGVFFLKDLNSTNGTVVNGQPVTEARLNDLDRIRFADVTAQFVGDAATAPSQPIVSQPIVSQPAGSLVSAALAKGGDRLEASPTTDAPARAQPAPVAAPTPRPQLAQRRSMPVPNLARLLTSLTRIVPYVGAAAAVTIVSLVGWHLFHLNRENVVAKAAPQAPLSLVKVKEPVTDVPRLPPMVEKVPDPVPKAAPVAEPGSSSEGVPQLMLALKAPEVAERRRAATTLHNLGAGAKEAAPALREALQDPDGEVQMWSALTLINNQSYDKAEIPVLISALQHDNSVVRQVVCLSLALIPYEETEKATVVAALSNTAGKDVDDDVRKAALSVLNIISPDTASPAVSK